jgi:hypothetical protein
MDKTGESHQTALRHVRGFTAEPSLPETDGATAELRPRVWSNDVTLFVAESLESAKHEKALLGKRVGDFFPWVFRNDWNEKEWFEIDPNRELRLDDGKETTTRTAHEWAARLPAGFMAVIDMNTGTLQGAHWLEARQAEATEIKLVTYYAVVHGEPRGTQTFGPMRKAPGFSRFVFTYEAPETSSDDEMRQVFNLRFLPLKVSFFDENGNRRLSDDYSFRSETAYEEARMYAGALLQRHTRWVIIATKDDRIISVRPKGIPKSPMPFPVAEHFARNGSMIARLSWRGRQFLPSHGKTPGSYTMRLEDGRMEEWVPTDEDKAANDWTAFGPEIE